MKIDLKLSEGTCRNEIVQIHRKVAYCDQKKKEKRKRLTKERLVKIT